MAAAGMADTGPASTGGRIRGLRCKNCLRAEPLGLSYVCPACFGPLEVVFDYEVIRSLLDWKTIEARAPGIWRYLELLPVTERPERSLSVGSTPLVHSSRHRQANCNEKLVLKKDNSDPTHSFKIS